jgi:hypothetical protein
MTPTQTALAYAQVAVACGAGLFCSTKAVAAFDRTPAFRHWFTRRWIMEWGSWLLAAVLWVLVIAFGSFGLPGLLNGLDLP